jgi:hypothetical protein
LGRRQQWIKVEFPSRFVSHPTLSSRSSNLFSPSPHTCNFDLSFDLSTEESPVVFFFFFPREATKDSKVATWLGASPAIHSFSSPLFYSPLSFKSGAMAAPIRPVLAALWDATADYDERDVAMRDGITKAHGLMDSHEYSEALHVIFEVRSPSLGRSLIGVADDNAVARP